MGKNQRHKKKLKAEKGKTKLKTTKTKFLPKGQNVTNTNFKIKPITIREQLVKHTDHITSKNLNFKDILNRIKHHNVMVKIDNLQQMREYISSVEEDQLPTHVLDILEVVCPLYTAVEQKVRREAVNLTGDLIGLISDEGTEPYLDRIISYLCCGMSHLSESIQEDSLLVFDVLLTHVPNLLATRCDKIIKNFILLVSKIKTGINDKSMLQTSVKNKKTSVQWRLMVLLRLKKFLKIIMDLKLNGDNKKISKPTETIEITAAVTYTPLYYNYHLNSINIYGQDINVSSWLDVCIEDILPLLKDIWIEIKPKYVYTKKSGDLYCTALNEETANILNCIVSIVSYFYELMVIKCKEDEENNIEKPSFVNKSKKIIELIYECFPYARENSDNNSDMKCLEENLTLCFLFLVFFNRIYRKDLVVQTLSYLNICLLNRQYVGQDKSPILLKVLKQFYKRNIVGWDKYRKTDLAQFIKNTAKYYINATKQVDSIEIFIFLCDQIDVIDSLFLLLVQKACQHLIHAKIEQKTFKIIRWLVLQEAPEVQQALSKLLPQILDNIKMVELEDVINEELKTLSILSLYRHVPLSDTNIKCLLEFGARNHSFQETVQSIIHNT